MTTKLKYGSLFSGVGGFDMGFDQEGYECVFQVEWDKHCQNILAKHWPEVPKWSDVQDVNGAEIPPCDVLTFGSPCQDLSVAGKRAGLEGTKSSMFYEATRIIEEMRNATKSIYPRVVIWENVPGALSSNNGADFGAVIDTLADIGAVDIHWSVLDAQHFGVPQRRRRIFVVAIFDPATSDRCSDPLLPVIKGSRGDFAKGKKARENAARSAEGGIDPGGQWWDGETTADCLTTTSNEQRMPDKNRLQAVIMPNQMIGALCARDNKGVGNQYVDEGKLVVQSSSETHDPIGEPIPFRPTGFADYSEGVGTLRTTEMGATASHLVVDDQPPPYAYDEFNDSISEIHHAIRAGTKQSTGIIQPIYYDALNDQVNILPGTLRANPFTSDFIAQLLQQQLAVRRLTPLECERLMGWPDDHTRWTADGTEQADTHRYRQCGNGVATPVAKWIAKHLKNILITNDNE